ncbi:ABC transporter permease [Pseudooctadecabacter jejudonensis]|uniref:Outer membrane-specific lipoprotein transporter subunit LolC n=1 Tax=Pseudooctadecabacter jejudonensis TaxID=1391910 RepID=A0A1Y5S448_9RHOB|nr:ABC transporter permease [Pseudooctadecabacter jejudonensis]SLN31245.1 outer membrane-specific lipoprotein transporter subunit LolC [Pseudooctadecabacter jejudonensis]
MTRAGLAALLSHWRRNPLQLFTLVVGLSLATALWSGVQAVNAEARASYDAAAETLGEGQFAQITSPTGSIDQSTYIALRRAGWQVSPVAEGRLEGIRLIGLDPLTAPGGLGPVDLSDGELTVNVLLSGVLFATQATLDRLPPLDVATQASTEVAPDVILTDVGTAQRLLGLEGQLSRLIVAPVQPKTQPPLADIAPDLTSRPPQAGSDVARLTDSFHLNLTAFGLLSFAVGIFIVHGAIGLAFEQRRPVIRTLRALGFPLRRLVALIAVELLALSIIAGAIGVGLGYLVAAALLPDVAATLSGLYGASVSGTLQLRPEWWLSGLAIAVGGTGLAASASLYRLSKMPLLASARPRAWAMQAGQGRLWQGVAALALLVLAAALAWGADGLVAGFGMLAALLIGAALALPLILDRVLAFGASRARSVMGEWFWADTRQQLPGLSLALMALLLAMAANVGVSTMVSSFRLTFTGFLDQRLASEFYVYADDAEQATALRAYLEPRVDRILPIQNATQDIRGVPSEIFGPTPDATYHDNWQFLQSAPDAWARIEAGEGTAINEQLARRADIAIGDAVIIAGQPFDVLGIYGDYGNPIGQALITEATFEALYPDITPLRFGVRMDPQGVTPLSIALRDDFGLAEANMINQAGIKAFSLDVFDRTFTVTGALNVLTLAVAGFAILMSLLTLATMRLPQLAPVWAQGLTRARLGRIEVIRAVLLALLTAALALPLGLALAWTLLAVVNVEAFGWRLPMFLFPLDYLRLAVFAVVAAVLAALWPARRLARTRPADLLKVFSNER